MAEAVAHGAQSADRPVQLVRFGREQLPVNPRIPARSKHERDLVEREAGGAPECDQRHPLQHAGIEQTAEAPPADRRD